MLCIGLLLTLAAGAASADDITEYTSLASWNANVTNPTFNTIAAPPTFSDGVLEPTPAVTPFDGDTGQTIGLATFTTPDNLGIIFNDGLFGKGVQYVAASPGAFGPGGPATVIASFDPSENVSAAAFTVAAENTDGDINIAVNGVTLEQLVVSSDFPTAFFGVTDIAGPITSVSFTVSNFGPPGSQGNGSEMDVIRGYSVATVNAPEMDSSSTIGAITLLFGYIAVLRARRVPAN
jgi:hypothetical protein